MGSIYYTVNDDVTGGKYCVPSSSLAYSVMIFSCAAVCCLFLFYLRRKFIGGELGGPKGSRVASAIFLVGLWLFYIVMSALKAEGHIAGIGSEKVFDFFGCDCKASFSSGRGCPV
mmetsp:Transcript_12800/g.40458  ORF Transcript_12800/g.40458 Transcript_12800/m.40458 type:complete len:115 (+) Transcript_12800:2708-3052(+)